MALNNNIIKDKAVLLGASVVVGGAEDDIDLGLIPKGAGSVHANGNFYATTYGSDGSVTDAELKAIAGNALGALGYLMVGAGAAAAPVWTAPTGTGPPVKATNPVLIAPALGIPGSGVLTNCSGLPIGSGVSGLGLGVAGFLATPSSANLLAAITNETGSGLLVFNVNPTFVGLNLTGTLYLGEIATPSAIVDYGAIYPKADNRLYFQDGDGAEHIISITDTYYAGMYLDNNGTDTVINTAAHPVMCHSFTTGSLQGFTFDAGRIVEADIGQETDESPQLGITTIGDHDLTTGDVVSLTGMLNAAHNGITAITYTGAKTFTCDDIAYVANAGDSAGHIVEGSHLIAGVGSDGIYILSWHVSTAPAGADTIKLQMYINSTPCPKCTGQRKFDNNDQGNIVGGSIITIAAGDRISLAVTNTTGTNDVISQYGNFMMHRL